jgi:Ca2+-binding RTX toxin-like protein
MYQMDRVHVRRLTAIASVVVCALVSAASASAATTNPFGCRASLARIGLGGTTLVEPIVANKASSPCATETSGLNSASVPSVGSVIALAGPAGVFTYSSSSQPTTTGTVAPGAAALAAVDGVTIPTSSGPIVIVGPVQASASYACVNGGVVAKSNSTLDLLYINGNRITLTPNENETIQLGGGNYVSVNEKLQTSTSITERILDVHLQGLADIVVGEAKVTQDAADPCAGTSSSAPPAVNPCPNGSTYDPVSGYCVIQTPGGGVIVISRPFQGPTGGTVLAVSVARKLYKSKCLAGRGPAYAIVGTNRNDRINGTHRPERILGLGGNDRIAGQGGNDCLDGGAGNDRMWGGNGNNRDFGGSGNDRISVQNGNAYVDGGSGNDRIFLGNGNDVVYGGPGNDRISVGRGRDRVYGGPGNDDISTGDGNDWVWGGSGNDRIWVGNGKDHVFGQAGDDRVYAPGEKDYVDCGGGANLAFVNLFAASYAQRHGCGRVRMVRPHRL